MLDSISRSTAGETLRVAREHSDPPATREKSPLRSSIGQADLTTRNPRPSRIREINRGLTWSTRPDSNWRPSRWQEKPNPRKINELRLSHWRGGATSGEEMSWGRQTAPRRHQFLESFPLRRWAYSGLVLWTGVPVSELTTWPDSTSYRHPSNRPSSRSSMVF